MLIAKLCTMFVTSASLLVAVFASPHRMGDMSIANVNAWIIFVILIWCTFLSLSIPLPLPSPFLTAHTYTNAHNTRDYTQSGETALHDAVNQGYEDIVELLLEANIDPDVADKVSHMTLTVPNMKYHLLHTVQNMSSLIDYDALHDEEVCPVRWLCLCTGFNLKLHVMISSPNI